MVRTADTFLVNADRSREEIMTSMRRLREKLHRLERDQEEDMKELDEILRKAIKDAERLLMEHIKSNRFRERFCSWKHEEGPPADMRSWEETDLKIQGSIQNRLKRLIQDWEDEEQVFAKIRKSLISEFLSKYREFERKLFCVELAQVTSVPDAVVRGNKQSPDDVIPKIALAVAGMIFLPLNLSASLLGVSAIEIMELVKDAGVSKLLLLSPILPLWAPCVLAGAIRALPAGLSVISLHFVAMEINKFKEEMIKKYEEDRGPFLRDASSTYLASLLYQENYFSKCADHLLSPASECLKQVKAGIPHLSMAYRQLHENLENDKRSKEEIKETYIRLKEDCEDLRSKLRWVFPELLYSREGMD